MIDSGPWTKDAYPKPPQYSDCALDIVKELFGM